MLASSLSESPELMVDEPEGIKVDVFLSTLQMSIVNSPVGVPAYSVEPWAYSLFIFKLVKLVLKAVQVSP